MKKSHRRLSGSTGAQLLAAGAQIAAPGHTVVDVSMLGEVGPPPRGTRAPSGLGAGASTSLPADAAGLFGVELLLDQPRRFVADLPVAFEVRERRALGGDGPSSRLQ